MANDQENLTEIQALQEKVKALTIGRISIKIPPFWPDDPELWFAQIEAQFDLNKISAERTKFSYVSGHLEGRWAKEVADLIRKPPTTDPYTTLKKALIDRLSKSEAQRIRQILGEEEIGDSTPSQFLRRLQSLAGNTIVQDNMLKTVWLQRLPTSAQAILQTQPENSSLDQLAKMADRIIEAIPTKPNAAVFFQSAPLTPTKFQN
nr:PREDICTED: uncharacterized protein LOC109042064 [Bemisia tabaci]